MSDAATTYVPCPRCEGHLDGDGPELHCGSCGRAATVVRFEPLAEHAELASGAGRCANHPGKDAVASCTRCGSFVCGVCLTRTGENSLCPACFDLLHARSDLATTKARRIRWDYAAFSAAAVSMICSMPFGVIGGPLALGFGIFALVRRRKEPWLSLPYIVIALALSVLALGLAALSIAGLLSEKGSR